MISNLSIKAKLVLLLLAPLLTLVVFAGIAVADRFDTAAVANDATNELEVAESAMVVVGELGAERSTAVQLLINSRDGRDDTDAARERTDAAVTDLSARLANGSFDLDNRSVALDALQRLATNRQLIDTFAVESAEAYEGYNGVIDDLLALETEILSELGDTELLRQGQLTLAGVQGRERVSRQTAFLGPRLELVELTGPDYVAFSGLQNEEELFFSQLEGSDEISGLWQTSRNGSASAAAESLVDAVNVAGQGGSIPSVTADVWWEQMTAKAESLNPAAAGSFDTLLDNSESKASSARTGAILFSLIALFIILFAVLMALALARSIARRLLRLSEEANTIATERLPEVLESLRNPTPEALSGAMPTINSDATDEIGVMADSFDTVLRTSVETSIEHSQQRAKTITDLLVNLGRRNQALIGNQLALIDDLEAREEDPELLESLYSLDSLITRNRRNSENLLVLAGETASRSSNAPVSLYEIVQAAMGEVSDLDRIEITGASSGTEMLLGKPAVNLSHLVAELLDNALSFSAKTTKVTAHIESKMGEHRIWVIDKGVGMTDEELVEANARLADPTDIDELSTDRIGFQVIGRLAQRLGVTLALTRNPYGGLAAKVDIPRDLLISNVTPAAESPEPQRDVSATSSRVEPTEDDRLTRPFREDSPSETVRSVVGTSAVGTSAVGTYPAEVGAKASAPAAVATSPADTVPVGTYPAEVGAKASAPAAVPKLGTPKLGTPELGTPKLGTSEAEPSPAPAAGSEEPGRVVVKPRTAEPDAAKAAPLVATPLVATPLVATPAQPAPSQAAPAQPAPSQAAPAATGKLNRRTPGASLANDLKAEAAGRVTHRRLGDGKSSDDEKRAERRRAMNSKLARSIDRRQIKEQNQ